MPGVDANHTPPATARLNTITTFLEDEWSSRLERALAATRPEQTEEALRHGLPLVMKLVSPDWKSVRDAQLGDMALVFEGPSGRTGIAICTQPNMNSLAAQLKRLRSQFGMRRVARLIVLRDGRVPLSKGAKVARQSLDDLEHQGAIIAHPAPPVLAALDALRALLSDAQSGDLAHAGEGVAPRTVEEWLMSHLPDDLREFAEQLAGTPTSTEQPRANDWLDLEELAALLTDHPLLPLDEAAELLKRPAATVAATIQRHPNRFGLLAGPPPLLFRITGEAG